MTADLSTGSWLTEAELSELEGRVCRALISGRVEGLEILGYGEISIVLGWQGRAGRFACKRLPPFRTPEALEAYEALVGEYLVTLGAQGTPPLPTRIQALERQDGQLAVYCLQPILDAAALGPRILKERPAGDALAFLGRVLTAIRGTIGPGLGVDAQISNWALVEGGLGYLDVATPLLRDEAGRERLDTRLFAASLPWALRGPVRWWMLDDILGKYYDPRRAVLDLLGNLIKEDLGAFLPEAIGLAGEVFGFERPLGLQEVERYYRSDARMWAALQWLRRRDRWWQRRVRRRAYPFLLPEKIERRVP